MDESRVMQLVSHVLNTGCTPEDVCRGTPELLAEVREQLKRIESIDAKVEAFPRVPGHEVLSLLGHGGMGVVYAARDVRLNRTVAVKTLLGGVHTDPAGLERLLREAEAVAALRHPNIVQVHDVGEHEGLTYFTMELVGGGSLRERIEEHPLDIRESAALVAKLAEAMDVAHENGIVHRDLKPANVLFTTEGVPKIVDFGLARRIDVESSLTLTTAMLGTPSYMAPEQARGGSHECGPPADVYALGAILYATLTGGPPFRSDVVAVTLRQVVEDEPVLPSRLNARVPRDLETICLKCLSKEPAQRYATAGALALDLQRFARGEPILARPVGVLGRLGKWVRRRPAHATIVAGAVLVLLALAGGGTWLSAKRSATVHAVEVDLVEVDRAVAAGNWAGARMAVEKAKARLADGGPAELVSEVDQCARELGIVDKLDAILLNRAAVPYASKAGRDSSALDAEYEKAFLEIGLADVSGRPREMAAWIQRSRIRAELVSALDTWAICVTGNDPRRDGLLETVRLADPDATGWRDRVRDPANWKDKRVLAELTSTAPLATESVLLLRALASHLIGAGLDAVPFLEKIQQEHPNEFWSNFALGVNVLEKSPASAVRYLQAAMAVRPDDAITRGNLGAALGAAGQVDEAIVQLEKALFLDGTNASAHVSLSTAYASKGRLPEAIEVLRAGIGLDPAQADTREKCLLAGWLLDVGRLDESIARSRATLSDDPSSFQARCFLAYALHLSGLLEEAAEEYRGAIQIEQRGLAHESLGLVLQDLGRMDDAIASFREAVRRDPRSPSSRMALVKALIASGRIEESLTEARAFLKSRSADDRGRAEASALLERCELLARLERNLPLILAGDLDPKDGDEYLALGELFRGRRDHAAAARSYDEAINRGFQRKTVRGDWFTFDAARSAVAAASIEHEGERALQDEARTSQRTSAHAWIQGDLGSFDQLLTANARGSRMSVRWNLMKLKTDPVLAHVRDAALLERLPEDERVQWRLLWDEVDALSARANSLQ